MKLQHTLLYFTSILLLSTSILKAQEEVKEIEKKVKEVNEVEEKEVTTDTIAKVYNTQYYGLRVGIDLSKPLRSLLDGNYQGFEAVGDFRIRKNYYLAAAIGNEIKTSELPNIENITRGSYIKAGFNYNAYENWFGMNNLLYGGIHAGFSTFNQELESYTIYTDNSVFPDNTIIDSREFNDLTAAWLELKVGLEVEVLNNLYLGINLQLKRSITAKEPDDFANLFIPGFGKVTEDSSIGVGYGYTISYLIPFFKK